MFFRSSTTPSGEPNTTLKKGFKGTLLVGATCFNTTHQTCSALIELGFFFSQTPDLVAHVVPGKKGARAVQ